MKLKFLKNQCLASQHTFAMPAIAESLFELTDVSQLRELEACPEFSWSETQILAGGSNSIFVQNMQSVLSVRLRGRAVEKRGAGQCIVTAAAGESWDDFVAWALSNGCYGLENLSLIPGSVGASPIQNIGAYGVEVSQFIEAIQVYNPCTPEKGLFWVDGEACDFGYRTSNFKSVWSHYLIVKVRFCLLENVEPVLSYAGLRENVQSLSSAHDIRNRVIELRQAKLPDPKSLPNAGSFFKNPVIDESHFLSLQDQFPQIPFYAIAQGCPSPVKYIKVPAAWLLDQLGLKGVWHGSFGCYQQQPLVLVHQVKPREPNIDSQSEILQAEASEFKAFVTHICHQVFQTFQIRLEIEPQILPGLDVQELAHGEER